MGAATPIQARLTELGLDGLAPLNHYTVKKGEMLPAIAKKLRVSRADLAEANYLSTKARLNAGQQLIIPRPPALLAATSEGATTSQSSDTVRATREHDAPGDAPVPSATTHRVKRGETLFSIAKQYGTTVALIKQLNRLTGNVIHVGQRLLIERLSALATN
jgi:membrane-bound lytic murein transglycosylase D